MSTPSPSPFRLAADQLASRLLAAFLDSLSPIERTWVRMAMRQRGWDFDRLCSRGLLAGVSDGALWTLAAMASEQLDALLEQHGRDVVPVSREAAAAELRVALER